MRNYIISLSILFGVAGCETTTPDWGKYRGVSPHTHVEYDTRIEQEQLDDPVFKLKVKEEAGRRGLRYVDFLHLVNSNKLGK
jgi:hypothetical protein